MVVTDSLENFAFVLVVIARNELFSETFRNTLPMHD